MSLIVSVHDVAPSTLPLVETWRDLLGDVPVTLLVVAGPWNGSELSPGDETCRWLRRRRIAGDEVALHGWAHRATPNGPVVRRTTGRLIARGAAEFWTLNEHDAAARLGLGLARLGEAGLTPVGFTPPGWLSSPETPAAARRLGLRYITSHLAVTDLQRRLTLRVPSVCHRPTTFGRHPGAAVVESVVRRRLAAGRPVRLGLHPHDLEHPMLVERTLGLIDWAGRRGARFATYEEVLAA